MKAIYLFIMATLFLTIISCSGNDPQDKDTNPPAVPKLVEHLGDTGDGMMVVDGNEVEISDDNNGIDADSGGDWINLRWEPFIDPDLSHISIFRFSESDPVPDSIATIPAEDNGFQDRDANLIEREWYSYFIKLYDGSGNFSVSDTVSYGLLAKCNLDTPNDGDVVSPVGLVLRWYKGDSYATRFRVLVWRESNNKLLYHQDFYTATEEDPLEINFPILVPNPPLASGEALRWRVDAFDDSDVHGASLGSESYERVFYLE